MTDFFRTRIFPRWPLLIAAAFGIYAYILLSNAYRSHDQLKSATEQQIVNEGKRQAAAIGDRIAERNNETVTLAESEEIAAYLANRALGMSLRYGLGTNLVAIEERFRRHMNKPDLRGEPIFRRIAFIDNARQVLVDAATGNRNAPLPQAMAKQRKLVIDTEANRIVISVPVMYKGEIQGNVIAIGDLAQLSRDLLAITDREEDSHKEFLITLMGQPLPSHGKKGVPPQERLRAFTRQPDSVPIRVADLESGNGIISDALVLKTPVPGADLALITIHSEKSLYGEITSLFFLYSASAFPLILLLAVFFFERMRRVGQALAQSEQRFHTIFNNIRDVICIIDREDGRIIETNPFVHNLYGYGQDEIIGIPIADLVDIATPAAQEEWNLRLAAARAGEAQFFEWPARRKNGEILWIETSVQRASLDGQPRLLLVARDISQRKEQEGKLIETLEHQKQLNHRLEETQNQLLQSEKMASIGQLAAGVAHEINNPIGFINSNLGSLRHYVEDLIRLLAAYEQEESALPAARATALAQLRQETDIEYLKEDIGKLLQESEEGLRRVRRIVADLKDFSHVNESERQNANLEAGLDSTLNVVWNELKYKAEVIKEYSGIPAIDCLASQLNQVFMNLLVNAAHAIVDRGRITLRTGYDEANVWVEIEDTGAGIPEENIKRIFEPFFTTKPVGQGTGLGLSLSYGIVRKHGGQIEVRSTPGVGSVFRVILPRQAQFNT